MTKMTPRDLAWRQRILNCPEFDCEWRNSTVCYGCQDPGRQPMRPKEEVVEAIVLAALDSLRPDGLRGADVIREVVLEALDPLYEIAEYNKTALRLKSERLEKVEKDLRIETEGREAIAQRNYLLERKLNLVGSTARAAFQGTSLAIPGILIGAAIHMLVGG